jgi:hypothetical protein
MNWFNNSKKFINGVEDVVDDMDPEIGRQAEIVGVIITGYVITSLSYFAVKGGKLVVKAIKNRH